MWLTLILTLTDIKQSVKLEWYKTQSDTQVKGDTKKNGCVASRSSSKKNSPNGLDWSSSMSPSDPV